MKILLLTQYFPPEVGAAQARLEAQSKEWIRNGHEVEVITCFPNYPEGKIYPEYEARSRRFFSTENWGPIRVRRFWVYASQGKGLGRLFNYLSFAVTALFALFQKRSPDLIFVNSGPLFLGIPGWIFARIYKAPMVFNVSDLWPRSVEHLAASLSGRIFVRLSEVLEKWIYSKADYINAITEGVEKILLEEKRVPPQKLLRLFNGVDLALFENPSLDDQAQRLREKYGFQQKFVLIYAGNHGFAHALDKVLLAAKSLQERGENQIRIVLIGGGSEKPRLQALSQELQIQNVLFLDPVPMKDLPPYLKMADMGLVHVKDSALAGETRPAKMFPMLAAGLPILFCGHGEGADLLRKLQAGEVLPPENPQLLAEALIRLQHQTGEFESWSRRGRDYISKNLSTQKLVADWLQELDRRQRAVGVGPIPSRESLSSTSSQDQQREN